jgi:hypothetical protein
MKKLTKRVKEFPPITIDKKKILKSSNLHPNISQTKLQPWYDEMQDDIFQIASKYPFTCLALPWYGMPYLALV